MGEVFDVNTYLCMAKKFGVFRKIMSFAFILVLIILTGGRAYGASKPLDARLSGSSEVIEEVKKTEAGLLVKVLFPAPQLDKIGDKTRIVMKGAPAGSNPGRPVLPCRTVRVLLPEGVDLEGVTVELKSPVFIGKEITPAVSGVQSPPSLDRVEGVGAIKFQGRFPKKVLEAGSIQRYRGRRILPLQVRPVIWDADSKDVYYYPEICIRIRWKQGAANRSHVGSQNKSALIWLNRQVVNPADVQKSSIKTRAGEYEYLIITHEDFAGAFERLVRHRRQATGVTGKVLTTAEIYDGFDGNRPDGGVDNQTRIRNAIKYYYDNHGTRYVLLGGDADRIGGQNIIPARGFYCKAGTITDGNIPADMYYGCLDGSFDHNGNGVYGEPGDGPDGGEVDLYAEVHVGRAPADSVEEAENFVSKVIAYETADPGDQRFKNVLLLGEKLWDDGPTYGGDYKDEIRYGTSKWGHTTAGFSGSSFLSTSVLYEKNSGWSNRDLKDRLSSGVHLVNHQGHGYVFSGFKLTVSDVNSLDNIFHPVIFSQGCYSGSFDNRNGSGDYYRSDCLLERMLTSPAGAVACVGNSRYGWGMPNSTNGATQQYDRRFWDALFREKFNRLGEMMSYSREHLSTAPSNGYLRWSCYSLNLLGDPFMAVRVCDAPFRPLRVKAQGKDTCSAVITWDDCSVSETGFSIYRRMEKAGYVKIADLPANSEEYTDTDCNDEGTKYFYRVYSTNSYGSGASGEVFATTGLAGPTEFNCRQKRSSEVSLGWKDNSQKETGYQVERKTPAEEDFSTIATLPADSTGYADNTAPEGANYYRVKAIRETDGNESPYSIVKSVDVANTGSSASIGGGGGGGGGCFIATAAYGTPMEPQVQSLRELRDRYLLPNPAGRAFVRFYYRNSPALADGIRRNETARWAVRVMLRPMAAAAGFFNGSGVDPALVILTAMAGCLVMMIRKRRCGKTPVADKAVEHN